MVLERTFCDISLDVKLVAGHYSELLVYWQAKLLQWLPLVWPPRDRLDPRADYKMAGEPAGANRKCKTPFYKGIPIHKRSTLNGLRNRNKIRQSRDLMFCLCFDWNHANEFNSVDICRGKPSPSGYLISKAGRTIRWPHQPRLY